jgi:hypothetical protein
MTHTLAAPLTFALLLAACDRPPQKAPGEQAPRARQACAEFPARPDDAEWPVKRPVAIPAALDDIVSATATTLTVQTFAAKPTCVDIGGLDISELETFAADRLVGYSVQGNEYYGYEVVDRRVPGLFFQTGDRPLFSPSGKRFAAVQTSGAAFGNLEGLGVWEVGTDRARRLFYLSAFFVPGVDAKIERWPDDGCVIASYVADTTIDEDAIANAPRIYLRVRGPGAGAEVETVEAGAGCTDPE